MSITITGVRLGLLAVLLVGGLARAQDGGTTDAAGPVDGAFPDASVPCGTVDALGECQGTTLRWCDRGRLQQEDCFTTWGSGFACHLAEPLGQAECFQMATDAGLPLDVVDAGDEDAGPVRTRQPVRGIHCVRPGFGPAALMGALWWWRRPRPPRRGT